MVQFLVSLGWRIKIPHAVQPAKRIFLMACVVCVYTHTPYFNTRNYFHRVLFSQQIL